MTAQQTTLAITCSCGRRLTVPKRLGGQRIKCVGCNRAVVIPNDRVNHDRTQKPARKTKVPPLPTKSSATLKRDENEEDSQRFVGITAGIIAGVISAILLLCLLFWYQPWNWASNVASNDNVAAEKSGKGNETKSGVGDDQFGDTDEPSAQREEDAAKPKEAPAAPDVDVEEATEPVEDPAIVDEEDLGASESPTETEAPTIEGGSAEEGEQPEELSQQPSQGGTRKTITGLTESTLAGVKVYGDIALVCDISGSMHADLPKLVKELREKFPADTPLLLVPGCGFYPPMGETPQKGGFTPYAQMGAFASVRGSGNTLLSLVNDPHVYSCSSTTDAIVYAATELGCDTVMFNNDLQDSGSVKSIDRLQDVHDETGFRLSGRSLERDAPQELLDFIKQTGGDFKVDPIYRAKRPALRWAHSRSR